MANVDLTPLVNWTDPDEMDASSADLSSAGAAFSETVETFAAAYNAMAGHYEGPGSPSLHDVPYRTKAFGEGCRALTVVAQEALQALASGTRHLLPREGSRPGPRPLVQHRDRCPPLLPILAGPHELSIRFRSRAPSGSQGYPDWEILAEEPPSPMAERRNHPECRMVTLSEWRPVARELESAQGHRVCDGFDFAHPATTARIQAEVDAVRASYVAIRDEAIRALAEVRVDSSAFNAEVSKSDSVFDNGLWGLFGTAGGLSEQGPRGHQPNPAGSPVSVRPKAPGVLELIDLLLVVADKHQDARTRVELTHPEWGSYEKGVNVVWQTLIYTITASTVGAAASMLEFALWQDALHVFLGTESMDRILSLGGADDAVADWLIKVLRGE